MSYSASRDKGNVNTHFPDIEDIPTHPAIDILDWVIDNELVFTIRPTAPENADNLGKWCVTFDTPYWIEPKRQVEYWHDDPMSAMANARAAYRKMVKGNQNGYASFSKGIEVK